MATAVKRKAKKLKNTIHVEDIDPLKKGDMFKCTACNKRDIDECPFNGEFNKVTKVDKFGVYFTEIGKDIVHGSDPISCSLEQTDYKNKNKLIIFRHASKKAPNYIDKSYLESK